MSEERLNELFSIVNEGHSSIQEREIRDYITNLQQKNKQLKDNWNKLKEWLKEYKEGTYGLGSYETGLSDGLGDVIKKMQELQGSDSDE